jgi:hypothetical protein
VHEEYFGRSGASEDRCETYGSAGTVRRHPVGLSRQPHRRGDLRCFASPAPPPPATDDLLLLRLAEELEYARRMMDAMGDALCADPAVVMRHSVSLQSVDIVGQMLGHIANVVRSSRREDSVELIGMCELKARLTRRSLG